MRVEYRLLGKKRRTRLREMACHIYTANPPAVWYSMPQSRIAKLAKRKVELEYNSILTSILIGIDVRLVVELIKHWALNNATDPHLRTITGEPCSE